MSNLSTKYWRCSSASGVRDSFAKTEHRKSSIPGNRSETRIQISELWFIISPTHMSYKMGPQFKVSSKTLGKLGINHVTPDMVVQLLSTILRLFLTSIGRNMLLHCIVVLRPR